MPPIRKNIGRRSSGSRVPFPLAEAMAPAAASDVTASVAATPATATTQAAAKSASNAMQSGLRSDPAALKAKKDAKAYEDFEGYFLQTFVEAMLPKDASSLFGSGPAGNIWKSMMAEYMAKELAHSTAFGIAEKIAEARKAKNADSILPAKETDKPAAPTPEKTAGYLSDLRKLLSTEGAMAAAQPAGSLPLSDTKSG